MATTLPSHLHFLPGNSPPTPLINFKNQCYFSISKKLLVSKKSFCRQKVIGHFSSRLIGYCKAKGGDENGESGDESPPFDINLAVILAGFAFEAYTTPSVISLILWCLYPYISSFWCEFFVNIKWQLSWDKQWQSWKLVPENNNLTNACEFCFYFFKNASFATKVHKLNSDACS